MAKTKKYPMPIGECGVSVWEERDRLHIHLFHRNENHTVAEWWDDDARAMIEDGFFTMGRGLKASVLDYAKSVGLVA